MTFGYDERDIEAWGRMCVLVDMEDIPESLSARRQVSKSGSHFPFHRRHFALHSYNTHRPLCKCQEFANSRPEFLMKDES